MPIYECHCMRCETTFEVLARVGHANKRHSCPGCGRPSPRIASTFAIVSERSGVRDVKAANSVAAANAAAPKRRSGPPLCLQNPHIPLLCHMDQKSGERFVAHFNGRGDEYDDRMASREELRRKRGLPPPPEPPPSGHLHESHHVPVADAAAHADSHHDGGANHSHGNRTKRGHALNSGANANVHSHSHGDSHSHGKAQGSQAGSHAHPH